MKRMEVVYTKAMEKKEKQRLAGLNRSCEIGTHATRTQYFLQSPGLLISQLDSLTTSTLAGLGQISGLIVFESCYPPLEWCSPLRTHLDARYQPARVIIAFHPIRIDTLRMLTFFDGILIGYKYSIATCIHVYGACSIKVNGGQADCTIKTHKVTLLA
jgi:hypothetical protein